MKPLFSETYYRKNWDRFMRPVPGEHYINLEADLEREMRCYVEAGLDDASLDVIRKHEAGKIIKRASRLVRDEMRVVERVEAGEASFGYTTLTQELQARADFRKRFEFNCYQLSVFRKKYGF